MAPKKGLLKEKNNKAGVEVGAVVEGNSGTAPLVGLVGSGD